MIKYTKSKPQCSYLKFRVSTRQATNMKFVMHRYLILRWGMECYIIGICSYDDISISVLSFCLAVPLG